MSLYEIFIIICDFMLDIQGVVLTAYPWIHLKGILRCEFVKVLNGVRDEIHFELGVLSSFHKAMLHKVIVFFRDSVALIVSAPVINLAIVSESVFHFVLLLKSGLANDFVTHQRLRTLAQLWTASSLWYLLCRWQRLEDLLESLLNFPLNLFLFLRNLSLLQALLDYSTCCPPSHLQIPWI